MHAFVVEIRRDEELPGGRGPLLPSPLAEKDGAA